MRLIFVGSKGMGVLALEELHRRSIVPTAIITRWDDPTPGQWFPSVTARATELYPQVLVLQPTDINDAVSVARLRDLAPDLMLTAFYPRIYTSELLSVPRLGSVNLHFAPLPRYRGSYPGAWAIINGETEHGVTLHVMDPGVDSGAIIDQRPLPIEPSDTGQTLYHRCEQVGLRILQDRLPELVAGTIRTRPQVAGEALYYGRHYPLGGVVNFGWSSKQVVDYVRALRFPPFDYPVTFHEGRPIQVRAAAAIEAPSSFSMPGAVLAADQPHVTVATADGAVVLSELVDARGRDLEAARTPVLGDILGR